MTLATPLAPLRSHWSWSNHRAIVHPVGRRRHQGFPNLVLSTFGPSLTAREVPNSRFPFRRPSIFLRRAVLPGSLVGCSSRGQSLVDHWRGVPTYRSASDCQFYWYITIDGSTYVVQSFVFRVASARCRRFPFTDHSFSGCVAKWHASPKISLTCPRYGLTRHSGGFGSMPNPPIYNLSLFIPAGLSSTCSPRGFPPKHGKYGLGVIFRPP